MALLIVFQVETFNILLIYFHDLFILWLTYKAKTLSENEKSYQNKSFLNDNEANNKESFIEKNKNNNLISFSKLITWILLFLVTGLVFSILTLEIFYEEKLIMVEKERMSLFNFFRILYFSFLLINFIISIDFIRTNFKTVEVLKKSSRETDNINCFDYLKKQQLDSVEESFKNESKGNKINHSNISNKNKERIRNPFVFKTFSNINDDYNFIMNFNQESFRNDNTNSSFNNQNKDSENVNLEKRKNIPEKNNKMADSKLTESMISITNKFQFHKETYFKTRIKQLNIMSYMNLIYIILFITYTILKVTLFDDEFDYKVYNHLYIIPTSTKSILAYFLFQLSNFIPIIISLVVFYMLISRDLKSYDDDDEYIEEDYIVENKCNNDSCDGNLENNHNQCNENHHICQNTEVYNVHDPENKNQIYFCNEHKYISFSTNHKTLSLRNSKDEYFDDIKYNSDNNFDLSHNKEFDKKSVRSKKSRRSKKSKNSETSDEKKKNKIYLNSLKSNRLTEGEKFLLD